MPSRVLGGVFEFPLSLAQGSHFGSATQIHQIGHVWGASVITIRLSCEMFYVDLRLREINGRFIASADTPAGPSLGLGNGAVEAVEHALEPFGDAIEQLLESLPRAWRP